MMREQKGHMVKKASYNAAENDNDEDILDAVRERIKNPAKRIRVNLDEI